MNQNKWHEITLDIASNALDPYLMVPPSERDFGGEPNIETKGIRIRIGERPFARDLRSLYESNGRKLPPDFEVFRSYDIWLLTQSVSLIKEGRFKEVREVGYQVRFPDKPKITILDVLPRTEFVKISKASLKSEVDIQINGGASNVVDSTERLSDGSESFHSGVKLKTHTGINMAVRLSFSVMTQKITAIGIGDHVSEWVFKKDDNLLVGDQLMVQTLLTPKRLKKLKFEARAYATISGFCSLPVKLCSDWIKLECDLSTE